MAEFKVFYERIEVEYAIIEADSIDEAEELADINYADYDWNYCDGSMTGYVLTGESEEI